MDTVCCQVCNLLKHSASACSDSHSRCFQMPTTSCCVQRNKALCAASTAFGPSTMLQKTSNEAMLCISVQL